MFDFGSISINITDSVVKQFLSFIPHHTVLFCILFLQELCHGDFQFFFLVKSAYSVKLELSTFFVHEIEHLEEDIK